ncbi:hypothetical protein OE88DRAFT_1740389 [Heliocybe sulcata]|uniref:Uncharacterized protein n=1 Tax=Heliocybe sulcata TaxID=5364 RepID=A0A5C3MM14_9AGAM|nr:hypothetical protein OE88DRAFT_1740389 [Heliocybe sulcata]
MSKVETGEVERVERERKTGLTAYKNKDYKPAIRHLEKVLKIWPDDIPILVALGGAYLHTKDYQKCLAACEQVAKLSNEGPDGDAYTAEALSTMSSAFVKLGESKTAVKYYHKSLGKYHGQIYSKLDKSKIASR